MLLVVSMLVMPSRFINTEMSGAAVEATREAPARDVQFPALSRQWLYRLSNCEDHRKVILF